MIMFSFAFFCNLVRVFRHAASSSAGLLHCPSVFAPLCSYSQMFFYSFSLCVLFVPRLFCRHFMFFLPALPWQPERVSNALVGLLTLRLPSLGWVFLASSLRLRFPFSFGPLSPVYCLVAAQELAAYSCFITQSFWYSLKDLLAQLSASIRVQLIHYTLSL